jgi:hypothetical protein
VPLPLLCADRRNYLRLDLWAGYSFGTVVGLLVEGGDRREPVILARAIEVCRILAKPAQGLRELGGLLAGDSAGYPRAFCCF